MSVLPPPDEWNRAVEHSKANPSHILGPYEDVFDNTHMECSCGFDTAEADWPVLPPGTAETVSVVTETWHAPGYRGKIQE